MAAKGKTSRRSAHTGKHLRREENRSIYREKEKEPRSEKKERIVL